MSEVAEPNGEVDADDILFMAAKTVSAAGAHQWTAMPDATDTI